ncbi:hypothetical protein NDU88_006845 [Pleurodeles waltl]|uniref:Uncharacterized protein n=1 Tax=Pleurodeles waltl TaxID=8319 RepID=A0AAV7MDE4_PLEWA|nr:hypothetical protein NDU88_006845 [Pleurodeles waltl]
MDSSSCSSFVCSCRCTDIRSCSSVPCATSLLLGSLNVALKLIRVDSRQVRDSPCRLPSVAGTLELQAPQPPVPGRSPETVPAGLLTHRPPQERQSLRLLVCAVSLHTLPCDCKHPLMCCGHPETSAHPWGALMKPRGACVLGPPRDLLLQPPSAR